MNALGEPVEEHGGCQITASTFWSTAACRPPTRRLLMKQPGGHPLQGTARHVGRSG
jgi:hypothetical protein